MLEYLSLKSSNFNTHIKVMFTLTFMCKMPFYAMFTDWILLFKLCLLVVPNKNICLIGFLAKNPPKNNNNNKTKQTKTQTKNNTENVHWNKASFLACEPHEKYIYRLFCYSLTEKNIELRINYLKECMESLEG